MKGLFRNLDHFSAFRRSTLELLPCLVENGGMDYGSYSWEIR